jgi:peptide/nickel transport system permease protein
MTRLLSQSCHRKPSSALRLRGGEALGVALRGLGGFVLVRVLRGLLTLGLCVTLTFIVLRISGDPADMLLPDDVPADVKAEYRTRWGLDRTIFEQYLLYLAALIRGELGFSFADGRPAALVVWEAVPNTFLLGSMAIALALLIGIPLGMAAALRRNTLVDRTLMAVAVVGFSLPSFFLAILLILLFALTLRWLPSSGTETVLHMIMPTVTLAAGLLGKSARFARTSLLEVLGQPYIRMARAKGVTRLGTLMRHAMPNAAVPLLMFLGIEIGLILTGAVVVETIFAWPGLGRVLVTAAGSRDLPVVQAAILFVALVIVLSNLMVDILHAWIDPRVAQTPASGAARG